MVEELVTNMNDYKKMCFLTENETEKIRQWIFDNGCTLSSGYFNLCFDFSPLGNNVVVEYCHDGKSVYLEVTDYQFVDDSLRTVKTILVDSYNAHLGLSAEALETYFKLAREDTEAHLNEDCEPPGASITFEIHHDKCNVLAKGEVIECR